MMLAARFIHILGFTVWVGGMFFAYMALRPAAAVLAPPLRLPLWAGTLRRFFRWVWLAITLIFASGLHMAMLLRTPGLYVYAMAGLALVMLLVFAHVFFAPNRRLQRAVAAQDWPAAGAALAQIRMLVGLNLGLGLLTVAVGALGPLVG